MNRANELIYYSVIAGGIKEKLLESIINTQLLELFSETEALTETHIITTLNLHPVRAKKWLHLLCALHFLVKEETQNHTYYKIDPQMKMPKEDAYICKSLISTLQFLGKEDLTSVLRGQIVTANENWPPASYEESARYEKWLSNTSRPSIHALLNLIDFNTYNRILDVGSGDGTIACALAKQHPEVKLTLFNLPYAAHLIQSNILTHNLQDQITVFEGDFIKDQTFPTGHNCILFCRVLWDWSKEINLKLLKMAYNALPQDGAVIICELFKEFGYDKVLPYEYFYIYWDAYEVDVFKTSDEYRQLLQEVGFKNIIHKSHPENPYSSMLIATK